MSTHPTVDGIIDRIEQQKSALVRPEENYELADAYRTYILNREASAQLSPSRDYDRLEDAAEYFADIDPDLTERAYDRIADDIVQSYDVSEEIVDNPASVIVRHSPKSEAAIDAWEERPISEL